MTHYDERMIPHVAYGESHWMFSEHLARYAFASRFLRQEAVVLDLGCGCGYGSAFLAESPSRTVIGFDCSVEAMRYAQSQYSLPGLRFARADAKCIPIRSNSIDAVIALEALEHLHDPKSALEEARRVLKSGGVFIVSTPNRLVTGSGEVPHNPFHVREYTPEEFKSLLGQMFTEYSLYGQALSPAFRAYEQSLQHLWKSLWLMRGHYHQLHDQLQNRLFDLGSRVELNERLIGLAWIKKLRRTLMRQNSSEQGGITQNGQALNKNWERDLDQEFQIVQSAIPRMMDWEVTPYAIEKAPVLLAVCRSR